MVARSTTCFKLQNSSKYIVHRVPSFTPYDSYNELYVSKQHFDGGNFYARY